MAKDFSKIKVLITLILAGETIFILPFVLARIFRPSILIAFDINNLELGTYFSIYGMVAIFSYFFGGPLADKYPPRNLISLALFMTAAGGLAIAVWPNASTLKWAYAFWGFTTIFLFWAAMIKATRSLGGTAYQGRTFGFLEGGRGLTSVLIASLALLLFSFFMPEQSDNQMTALRIDSIQMVLYGVSAMVILVGLLVLWVIPKGAIDSKTPSSRFDLKALVPLLKTKAIWLQGGIIVCAYTGYKITDDFSLYANVVLGFDEVESASLGTYILWLRPVFAVLAGLLADRFMGSNIIVWCFALMAIGGLLMVLGVFQNRVLLTVLLLVTTLAGIYGLRGVYFATMQEAKVPLISTGTAVGIMSVLGYTPDVFMGPLMGYLLDNNPGPLGHQYVFVTLTIFALAGLGISWWYRNVNRKAV